MPQTVEIKQLSAQLANIKSDINRQEETLEECAAYKAFLAALTPKAWLEVRCLQHPSGSGRSVTARLAMLRCDWRSAPPTRPSPPRSLPRPRLRCCEAHPQSLAGRAARQEGHAMLTLHNI